MEHFGIVGLVPLRSALSERLFSVPRLGTADAEPVNLVRMQCLDGASASVASSVGTTAECAGHHVDPGVFEEFLAEAWRRGNKRAVRLLGVGVRFEDPKEIERMEFFE